ncbi:MAG: substrate-binding domain-containing protein [Bacteroidales bacterium]|nr:substrate-binding domain-containing protein [Bacteroidales bacterium]
MKIVLIFFIGLLFTAFSCNIITTKKVEVIDSTEVQGDLVLFYASSMLIPMQDIIRDFELEYPHVKVLSEVSGSRTAVLKISELNKPCDVVVSSDYQVIKNLLMPHYASWYIEFATNELVLAYNDRSHAKQQINSENWYQILLNDSVNFGRSDPDSDPCGMRSVLTIKLAEEYYEEFGLKDQLLFKNKKLIRHSDIELLKMLKKHEVDYIFVYKSVAIQNGLSFVELPSKINLGSADESIFYATVNMKVSSNNPGVYLLRKGEQIRYALTMLKEANNKRAAEAFIVFFTNKNKGLRIIEDSKIQLLDSLYIVPHDSLLLELSTKIER